ncbi:MULTISPECIES: helix-turn-helix domain-containing protein [Sphingomonas]|jgi:AraC-like DNA-binding protein|nr:AraC family transcriptional regulator [Sphingomonas ginsenosidimutans]MBY0302871.1 AraC family transcriptional regulator [Sphingomonas ginsenosidimutans]MEE2917084.1 AraC family transcriptional regulator [Pseudomonadota bacterium]
MKTGFVRPASDLIEVVAGFRQRVSLSSAPPLTLALPARPELFVEFYFGNPYRTRSGHAPSTVLVGPTTRYHTDIEIAGTIDTFTIKFQPSGVHRLFGLPGPLLVDMAEEAGAVEAGFRDLRERLQVTPHFPRRIDIAQAWLRTRMLSARSPDVIDRAARLIRRSAGCVRLDHLAAQCAIDPRSFRRRFVEAVGVSPKLYSRISRFHAALELKGQQPTLTWTHVSQRFGYFDQSHLLRDMSAFADGMAVPGRYRSRDTDAAADISYSGR